MTILPKSLSGTTFFLPGEAGMTFAQEIAIDRRLHMLEDVTRIDYYVVGNWKITCHVPKDGDLLALEARLLEAIQGVP